ncbi:MAG: hypothetical protein SF187_08555 [Deltaproteobacteria bacterium]|nr:hypothetical protein [Deltaproteobacteria bacterium]
MRFFGPTVALASLLGALALFTGCDGGGPTGQDKCVARVPATAVVSGGGMERPPLGAPTTEPAFGPCVERVSDHIGHHDNTAVHVGARAQAFNADGTVVLLRNGQVLRLSDKVLVGQFPSADSAWVWSPENANVAYAILGNAVVAFDYVAQAQTVVQRFARYQRLLSESGLSLPSRQNQWALGGELPQTNEAPAVKELFLWNANTQATTSAVVVSPDVVGRVFSPRWMQAVPSGEGLVVAWAPGDQPFSGIELYDQQGARVRQLMSQTPVCDVALDARLKSWLVCVEPAGNAAPAFTIAKHALSVAPAPAEPLLGVAIDHAVELSCAAHGTDTCVMGVTGGNSETPFAGEVTAFSLNGRVDAPAVWRLAHHNSALAAITSQSVVNCPIEPSAVMPHATLDRTAQRVLFGSNWATNCFAELYLIDFR